jgi:hypothetical protein
LIQINVQRTIDQEQTALQHPQATQHSTTALSLIERIYFGAAGCLANYPASEATGSSDHQTNIGNISRPILSELLTL